MTRLLRTQNYLEACQAHIEGIGEANPEIESFLSQFLLVVLCAEMQTELYEVVKRRVDRCGDEEICSFAVSSSKKILRSIKVSEITGFLNHFGGPCKQRFTEGLDDRTNLQYNSAVANRHQVAHLSGAQVTLGELEAIISSARKILDSAEIALSSASTAEVAEDATVSEIGGP